MILSQRIRTLREKAGLSQKDIERKTGLRRQYVSRLESGRTTPSIETLEKLAAALRLPLYQFFCTHKSKPAKPLTVLPSRVGPPIDKTTRLLLSLIAQMSEADRLLLLATARKMVQLQRLA